MQVWSIIAGALEAHECCALVTQAEVEGSAPREAGARMVVMPDGTFTGTIGGGALEWHALARAQGLMKDDKIAVDITRHALGPQMGQCCGGSVRLVIEVWTGERLAEAQTLAAMEKAGPFTTQAAVGDGGIKREITTRGMAGAAQIEWHDVLIEGFGQRNSQVYLFGAGHVGRAVMLALAPLPFDVSWIDTRREAFPSAVPGNVTMTASDDPAGILDAAPDGALVVVVTHSHALDLDIVQRALKVERFGYVGVIGSKTKRARFTSLMRKAGLTDGVIGNLVCPIGVAGITSKQPAAIGASLVAELLQHNELVKTAQNPVQLTSSTVRIDASGAHDGAKGIAGNG